MSSTSYVIELEYTDTFGGTPNYSWVDRKELHIPTGTPNYHIKGMILDAFNLSMDIPCEWEEFGDAWNWIPDNSCTIVMARVRY